LTIGFFGVLTWPGAGEQPARKKQSGRRRTESRRLKRQLRPWAGANLANGLPDFNVLLLPYFSRLFKPKGMELYAWLGSA
jgi:hypothetical protein